MFLIFHPFLFCLILQRGVTEYAMFESFKACPWVLQIYRYQDIPSLLASIKEHIIMPVEQKEYEKEKTKEPRGRGEDTEGKD